MEIRTVTFHKETLLHQLGKDCDSNGYTEQLHSALQRFQNRLTTTARPETQSASSSAAADSDAQSPAAAKSSAAARPRSFGPITRPCVRTHPYGKTTHRTELDRSQRWRRWWESDDGKWFEKIKPGIWVCEECAWLNRTRPSGQTHSTR